MVVTLFQKKGNKGKWVILESFISIHWFSMRDLLLLGLLIVEFVSSSSLIVYKLCSLLVSWWLVPLHSLWNLFGLL